MKCVSVRDTRFNLNFIKFLLINLLSLDFIRSNLINRPTLWTRSKLSFICLFTEVKSEVTPPEDYVLFWKSSSGTGDQDVEERKMKQDTDG